MVLPPPSDKQIPTRVKTAWGVGAIADGCKNAGFDVFLGLYYVTVLGLPGTMSGLALLIALLVDALSDPLVGSISDDFRSRWGRRHPFMICAALPMALCFFLLFSPPAGLGEEALFAWLLAFSIGTRLSLTLYKVPADALGPEMTDHYDERTTLTAFRWAMGLGGGIALQVIGWLFFFEDRTAVAEGRLDLDNFPAFGTFVAVVVATSIGIGTFGTRSVIPRLRPPETTARFSARRFLDGLRAAFQSHSLRILLGAAVISQTAVGVTEVLSVYMSTWFWGFDSDQMAILAGVTVVPVVIGVLVARRLTLLIGDKRMTFIRLILVLIVWAPLAVLARVFGLAPENGTTAILVFVIGHTAVIMLLAVQIAILSSSMLMDVADEVALVSGERHEGVVMSALSFAGKCTSGLGNFVGLSALQWIGFPSGDAAAIEAVPEETILSLGLLAGPGLIVFYVATAVLVTRLRLTRERYDEIREELARRR
ncbi:MAG: MFS transporter [bacterium]|nr:MFS transporter [bacterium]